MNIRQTRLHSSALLSAVVLAAMAGCADRDAAKTTTTTDPVTPGATTTPGTTQTAASEAWDKTKETAKDLYADAKEATMDGVEKLDRATYDERVQMKASLLEARAKIDSELVEWKREGKAVSSASETKLEEARAKFSSSVDSLGSATAEGWEAAKQKTAAAWADLKAAYEQAKAEHTG